MEVHMMRCVYWIPAFAGMTVVPKGLSDADFIPAFAGMTVKYGAIEWTGPKFPARQRGRGT